VTAPADTLILSDRVLTLDGRDDDGRPGCVAIRDGRIAAVAGRDAADGLRGPDTVVLDAGDRPLLPGFVDPHAHAEVAALVQQATVDCRAPECGTVADVLDALRDGLPGAVDGWLVGQGNLFFDQKLRERRLPTRAELDAVSRETAIALRAGGHVTVLNSRALELAGITRDSRAAEHSITGLPTIEVDGGGEPTGVVKEMDNLLPLPAFEGAALREALRDGMRELFTRHGVTTIGEISETTAGLEQFDALLGAGELAARMRVYLWAPGTLSLRQACAWREHLTLRQPDELIRVQGVKLFADGGYSAASAAVKRPYVVGDCSCGSVALSDAQIGEALALTRAAGLQLAVHANGDRAQEAVCAAIAAAGPAPEGVPAPRVEHAGNFLPEYDETTAAWRAAGIVPVPQPVFLYTFGDFFPAYLGEYGERGRFPFRRLLDDGWPISGSSDVWIGSEREATNPLFGVWCCVARSSFAGAVLGPEQRIERSEALRMHTLDAAAAIGEDDVKGSLTAGKLADVVVLDRDPLTCPEDDLRRARVDAVVFGGRLVHEREGARPLRA